MLLYPVIIVVARTFNKEGMFVQSALVAAAFGIGFAMYYSIEFPGFCKLIPQNAEAQYSAFFSSTGYIIRWLSPTIYYVIAQTTGDHKWALFHLIGYTIIALLVLLFIDFEKGMKEAGRTGDGISFVEMTAADSNASNEGTDVASVVETA